MCPGSSRGAACQSVPAGPLKEAFPIECHRRPILTVGWKDRKQVLAGLKVEAARGSDHAGWGARLRPNRGVRPESSPDDRLPPPREPKDYEVVGVPPFGTHARRAPAGDLALVS
jgi:hypothetical protein